MAASSTPMDRHRSVEEKRVSLIFRTRLVLGFAHKLFYFSIMKSIIVIIVT